MCTEINSYRRDTLEEKNKRRGERAKEAKWGGKEEGEEQKERKKQQQE